MKPIDQLTDDEFSQRVQQSVRALPEAPQAWQNAAVGLWPGATAQLVAAAGALVRHIVAVLSFDSWAAPATALGMRSLRSPTRHLLFSAQGRDIDLRIAPVAGSFSLAGQILGPDDGGTVELAAEDGGTKAAHVTALDPLGEFRIEGLHRGTYVMTLHMGNDRIVLPSVQVGEPAA